MARTIKPSWLSPAPQNLGSASHGKLSAAQWRTVCMVHLTITLTRLWFHDEVKRQYLDNFISLVIAVRWATMKVASERQISIVEDHFETYFRSMVKLFGTESAVPNHHMSLHLAQCIRTFGPVRGWWAFPFERYNGLLQQQNTNHKPGTLLNTSYNIYWVYSDYFP